MKRLKNLLGIKERTLEEEILEDLANYYNKMTPGSYTICKKYNMPQEQRSISYLLRNYRRKLNIAQAMEEEDRIKTSKEVIEEYKNEIMEKIIITNNLKKPLE